MLSSLVKKSALLGLTLLATLTIASAATDVPTKIVKVDQNGKTFTVHWTTRFHSHHGMSDRDVSHEVLYKTTDKTIYTNQGAKGSWANVQKGATVHVTGHAQGSDRFADKVDIK
jgi:hypothetical protein